MMTLFPWFMRLLRYCSSEVFWGTYLGIFRFCSVNYTLIKLWITYDSIFIPRFWIPFTLEMHSKRGHSCWIHNAKLFGNHNMLVCSHQIVWTNLCDLLGGKPFLEIAPRETNHCQVLLHVHGVKCSKIYNGNKKHSISRWVQKHMQCINVYLHATFCWVLGLWPGADLYIVKLYCILRWLLQAT